MKKSKKSKKRKPDAENPDSGFLGVSGKTWLIVGGVAVAALIAWKVYQARKAASGAPAAPSPLPYTGAPRGASAGPSTGVSGVGAQPCPPTPQAERSIEEPPADEFGGGELL